MFIYNLKATAKKLKIDYKEITSKINHNGEKGSAREEVLKKYLSDFLPLKFTVGNGLIIDSNEKQSSQQDFIIYDAFESPLMLKMQSLQVVPIESVYCGIEVKSRLTKRELQKCINNIKSVRSLEKCCLNNSAIRYENANNTIGFVFAYSSDSKLDTIYQNLVELNKDILPEHQISCICILDKGLILNVSKSGMNQLELYPNNDSVLACSENKLENNLYLFYLLLLQHLNYMKLLPPDLIRYAQKQNAFNIRPHMKTELLPDDGTVDVAEGISFKVSDVKEILSISKRMDKVMSGNFNKEELVDYLTSDFLDIININQRSGFIPNENQIIDIYGAKVTLDNLKKLKIINEKNKQNIQFTTDEEKFYNLLVSLVYNTYENFYKNKELCESTQ